MATYAYQAVIEFDGMNDADKRAWLGALYLNLLDTVALGDPIDDEVIYDVNDSEANLAVVFLGSLTDAERLVWLGKIAQRVESFRQNPQTIPDPLPFKHRIA